MFMLKNKRISYLTNKLGALIYKVRKCKVAFVMKIHILNSVPFSSHASQRPKQSTVKLDLWLNKPFIFIDFF